METVLVNESFLSQITRTIVAGVAGRKIGVRGLQLTLDTGPGAGSVSLGDGASANLMRFGNPTDPSVIVMPVTPDERTHVFVTTTGNALTMSWSYAGAGSVVGTIQYDWIVDPTGHIGNA